ncbi:MAG TPA: DUF6293 family protein [Nitrososphaera sp.]|jgi:hypothetical protein
MPVNLRVHIAPVGFDPQERVTAPLIEYRADKVYLVSRSKNDSAVHRMKQVHKALEKHPHIEVHDVYVNIWDLFSCLEKFRTIFDSEKGNHIYINVSTGSKIVSIAGMLACMLWDGTPYYARLNYDDNGPSSNPEERKVIATEFLPVYQINMPQPESLQVLSIIHSNGGRISKKKLIEQLQGLKMIPVYGPSQTKSAPHSRLRAILEPLESHWQFVQVDARGRKSQVLLTDQGKRALRIFGTGGG